MKDGARNGRQFPAEDGAPTQSMHNPWDEVFPEYPWSEGEIDAATRTDPEDVLVCAVRESPATVMAGGRTGRGRRSEVTLDSGCGKSVMRESMTSVYTITPSPASIAGQKFVGPGGES